MTSKYLASLHLLNKGIFDTAQSGGQFLNANATNENGFPHSPLTCWMHIKQLTVRGNFFCTLQDFRDIDLYNKGWVVCCVEYEIWRYQFMKAIQSYSRPRASWMSILSCHPRK